MTDGPLFVNREELLNREKERERQRELALSYVGLPPFDREEYLLGRSFPHGALHHTPNRYPLCVCTPFACTD